jgi:hypothetical protein
MLMDYLTLWVCCACQVTMVVGNDPDALTLVTANTGDCRAVLCRGGKHPCTAPHPVYMRACMHACIHPTMRTPMHTYSLTLWVAPSLVLTTPTPPLSALRPLPVHPHPHCCLTDRQGAAPF